jgi:protein-disulfide isomerase
MFKRRIGHLILAALLIVPLSARAAGFTPQQRAEIVDILRDALKKDPSILREAITALQEDDQHQSETAARAAIAAAGPALTRAPGDPVAGNPEGHVTLVEFYDVRCPYCRRMLPTVAALLAQDHDVRLVYKDLPVLGPGSVIGARALLAAQKQGGYQKLHDALMAGSPDVTEDSVKASALRLGLDWERLHADMTAPDVLARIDANLALAQKLQIQGTPAYIVGQQILPGAVELADLQSAVKAARTP